MDYYTEGSAFAEQQIKTEEIYVKEEPLEEVVAEYKLSCKQSQLQWGNIEYDIKEELPISYGELASDKKSENEFLGVRTEEIYLPEEEHCEFKSEEDRSRHVSINCLSSLDPQDEDTFLPIHERKSTDKKLDKLSNSNEKERNFTCAECNRTFSLKGNLSNHILSVHKKIKPHKCTMCTCAYTQKCELTHHILSVHKNINPHQCSICDSIFSTRGNLSTHILSVHWKVKPHKCPLCDSSFGTKQQLSLHNLSVHQKIKPHKCSMCSNAYVQKSHLSTHILSVHKKIKPHKCTLCDCAFSQKGLLSRHTQSVHDKFKPEKKN